MTSTLLPAHPYKAGCVRGQHIALNSRPALHCMAQAKLQPSLVPEVWWPLLGDSSCSGGPDKLLVRLAYLLRGAAPGSRYHFQRCQCSAVWNPVASSSAPLRQPCAKPARHQQKCCCLSAAWHSKAFEGPALPLHSYECRQCCAASTCGAAVIHRDGQTHSHNTLGASQQDPTCSDTALHCSCFSAALMLAAYQGRSTPSCQALRQILCSPLPPATHWVPCANRALSTPSHIMYHKQCSTCRVATRLQ